MATVPSDHKEAALALGMTRWEMIRTAVLPYSRSGITGAAMLGLGRAIGETIAVAFVIGSSTNDRPPPPVAGLHAGRDHRQRVRRGGQRQAALRRADRRRARAVRADADHQRDRARLRPPRRAAQHHAAGRPAGPGRGRHARSDVGMTDAARDQPAGAAPPTAPREIVMGLLTLIALIPLVLVLYFLLKQGAAGADTWHFFSTDPTGNFLGDSGRRQIGDPRHDRDRPDRLDDRDPDSASRSRCTSSSTARPAGSPASSATRST